MNRKLSVLDVFVEKQTNEISIDIYFKTMGHIGIYISVDTIPDIQKSQCNTI